MRVNIGPYRDWIGPYQLADKIPFISEDTADKIGEWLSETWVNDVCQWLYSKKKRKEYVRIDKYDTWNMDHTLAIIILPMLKQLRDSKHGSPYVDEEDLPPHMRHSFPEPDHNDQYGNDSWVHYKWEWILNEMIWAFEHIVDDSWEMKVCEKGFDNNVYNKYNERINNGTKLFGKYYRGLWD